MKIIKRSQSRSIGKSLRGFTLAELIIAVSLLGIVVIAVAGIDLASRRSLISASRRARVQDEVRFAMEHMVRKIRLANWIDPSLPIGIDLTSINIRVDDDGDPADFSNDTTITYALSGDNILYSNVDTDGDPNIVDEPIVKKITNLAFNIAADPVDPIFLTIELTAAHDPSTYDPSTVDPNNPGVTLHAGVTLRCKAKD